LLGDVPRWRGQGVKLILFDSESFTSKKVIGYQII